MRREWNWPVGKLGGKFIKALIEFLAVGKDLALARGPRSNLARPGPAVEIEVRVFARDSLDCTDDANLSF
jgi:hypothetical protein